MTASAQPVTISLRERLSFPGVMTALSLLMSAPIALGMAAMAGLVVALGSLPITLIATRDLYLTALSPSYGFFAAAEMVQWLIGVTIVWSLMWPITTTFSQRSTRLATLVGLGLGALAMLVGFTLAQGVAPFPPFRRVHQEALDGVTLGTALILGAVAGLISAKRAFYRGRPRDLARHLWRATARQIAGDMAFFAFTLALLLETLSVLMTIAHAS